MMVTIQQEIFDEIQKQNLGYGAWSQMTTRLGHF